jgi:hypothetical protein
MPWPKKEPRTHREEAGWAPDPIWTTWRREKSCPYGDSDSDPSVVQPALNIKVDLKAAEAWTWLDSSDSGYDPVTGSCDTATKLPAHKNRGICWPA